MSKEEMIILCVLLAFVSGLSAVGVQAHRYPKHTESSRLILVFLINAILFPVMMPISIYKLLR